MLQHCHRLAADVVLLVGRQRMGRQREKAPRRGVAFGRRQFRQALQQTVDQQPALEAVAPARSSAATASRGSAPLRPRRQQRPRRVGLGRRRPSCPGRQRASRCRRRDRRLASRRRGLRAVDAQPFARPAVLGADQRLSRRTRRAAAHSRRPARHSVCQQVCGGARRSASRRYRAGPAPGSGRHRAAGDIPASGASRARGLFGDIARCHVIPRRPPQRQPVRRLHSKAIFWSGTAIVSGKKTTGASRPLAPCTVMIRTSSRWRAAKSRLTSISPATSQRKNPCSDGTCSRS